MPTYETKDLIVLLPGIGGSVLSKDGKEVWGTSAEAQWRGLASLGGSVKDLELKGDDPAADDVGDGVTATGLIQGITILPGLWKIDVYHKTSKMLREAFGLTPGENYFEFAYDWRRDNRPAARQLQKKIDDWLAKWRKKSGNPEARAVLVAHSMGGLVSRYYLEVLGGWKSVRSLITFGTPYRGSLNAVSYLVNGFRKGIWPVKLDLSPVIRSLTSVYQLLPTYACVDAGPGKPQQVAETPSLPDIDNQRAKAALAFHQEIVDRQTENAANAAYRENGYRIFPIVGIEQPTLQSAHLRNNKVEMLFTLGGKDYSGDGTVPQVSATPLELAKEERETYAVEKHGCLQTNDAMLAQLRGILSRPHEELARLRATGPPITLSLDIEDAYATDEPVKLGITTSDKRPKLEARLFRADSSRACQKGLLKWLEGGRQEISFDPLRAGVYRVTVSGDDEVSPVSDVFCVAAKK